MWFVLNHFFLFHFRILFVFIFLYKVEDLNLYQSNVSVSRSDNSTGNNFSEEFFQIRTSIQPRSSVEEMGQRISIEEMDTRISIEESGLGTAIEQSENTKVLSTYDEDERRVKSI